MVLKTVSSINKDINVLTIGEGTFGVMIHFSVEYPGLDRIFHILRDVPAVELIRTADLLRRIRTVQ